MTTEQTPRGRSPAAATAVLALATAVLVATIAAAAFADRGAPNAAAARVLSVKDEGRLRLTGTNGSLLLEEGPAVGSVPGTARARFDVGATVTATFTIYAAGGSISGRGSGRLHSTSAKASFGGSLTVTGGSGRYRHAHGSGELTGTINRNTEAMTVQVVGRLSY